MCLYYVCVHVFLEWDLSVWKSCSPKSEPMYILFMAYKNVHAMCF